MPSHVTKKSRTTKDGTTKESEPGEIWSGLRTLRKRSETRRKVIAKELNLAKRTHLSDALDVLHSRRERDEVQRLRYRLNPTKYRSVSHPSRLKDGKYRIADDDEVAAVMRREEEQGVEDGVTMYKDSNIFLKGTQSANPHNDYSQHYVDTGQRPQNFIRDTGMSERFEEYPKLKELIRLKDEQIKERATPPMYLKTDLSTFDLNSVGTKFDVILIDPPLEEYQRRASGIAFNWSPWDWEEIMNLKIEDISAQRSFVFLWCGAYEGLDLGRVCLKKWGFRRCEDICWVKTNVRNPDKSHVFELTKAVFQNSKEHCLMGIKGTVRRNQDANFIHANIDLDVIITEESELGSIEKPEEIFHIMEHFCLGRRRLHLFGNDSTIRPGWLTLGSELTSSNYHRENYLAYFQKDEDLLLGTKEEIENLRPKTPPPKIRGTGRGRGMGRGGMCRGGGAIQASGRGF